MLNETLTPAANPARFMFDCFAQNLLPADTPTDVVADLISIGHPVMPVRGQRAFLDPGGDQIVYLVKGATKLVASISPDREQIVAFHFEGDLISLPAHSSYPYSLVALKDSHLIAFPSGDFLDCATRHSPLQALVLERVITALHRSRDKSVGLGRKSAEERMASFLLTMADRIGVPDGKCWPFDLPMSRSDIADALGLTIETVSRLFGRMRDEGLLSTSGRSGVTLLDPGGIECRAGLCRPAE